MSQTKTIKEDFDLKEAAEYLAEQTQNSFSTRKLERLELAHFKKNRFRLNCSQEILEKRNFGQLFE